MAKIDSKIVSYIKERKTPVTSADIRNKFNYKSASHKLKELHKESLIERKRKGRKYVYYIEKDTEKINEYIKDNYLYFYEWRPYDNIIRNLRKEGFDIPTIKKWFSEIRERQIGNNKFENGMFIIKTKGGVMGERGLGNLTRHARLKFEIK